MKKTNTVMVTARIPKPLAKMLEEAAEAQSRSKSAELTVRLAQTFPKPTRARSAAR